MRGVPGGSGRPGDPVPSLWPVPRLQFPPKSKIIGESMKREREPFDFLVQVKMPRSMAEDLNEAAASDLLSRSDLIRIKMADYLKSRGIEISGAA
jgi:hypothetical protein